MPRLQKAFEIFHDENPHVYDLFYKFTMQAIASGRAHFGVAAVWERLRWSVMIETNSRDPFKLNNDHRAYYARMFMRHFPQHEGFFRTRCLVSQANEESANV